MAFTKALLIGAGLWRFLGANGGKTFVYTSLFIVFKPNLSFARLLSDLFLKYLKFCLKFF